MDPFTLAAQVLNFLLLVLLLRRYLYLPLLEVMDERERRAAEQAREAADRLAEAEGLAARARAEGERLEATRLELLAGAEAEAAARRRILLDEARREVAARQEEWLEDLEGRREAAMVELRPRVAAALVALCRRALLDLAGEELEDRMAARLAERLAAPGALREGGPYRVGSSRPLGTAARAALERVLGPAPVEFSAPEPGYLGVRVAAGGWEMGWTLDSYLETLQERVEGLAGRERPHGAPRA